MSTHTLGNLILTLLYYRYGLFYVLVMNYYSENKVAVG